MFEINPLKEKAQGHINRRVFLGLSAPALAGLVLGCTKRPEALEAGAPPSGLPKMVRVVEFSDAGVRQDVVTVPKIVKSDADWRKQLSPASFDVTRKAGTELAFTGALLKVHDKGLFRCICCDTALYSSNTKFESGTGWPSFWAPLAKENVEEISDRTFGMARIAVSCRRCDAHLGHVFDDGPRPTGLRYCMNSVAMRFAKSV